MRQELCFSLVPGSLFLCCILALLVNLSFCAANTIPHFFYDLTILLKLYCSDIYLNELVIFTVGIMLFILSLSSILGSYIHIGTTVLRVSSTTRLFKYFSTCGSHLFVVSLYYQTLASIYLVFSSWDSNDKDTIASLVYAVVTPTLNPLIYCLRNRDIKQALEILVNSTNFLK